MNFLKRDFRQKLKNVHNWSSLIFYIGDCFRQRLLFSFTDYITP